MEAEPQAEVTYASRDVATLERKIEERQQTLALLQQMGEHDGARLLQAEIDDISAALAAKQAPPPVAVPIAVPMAQPTAAAPAVPIAVPVGTQQAGQSRVPTEEEQLAAALEASQASASAQSARAALEQANEEAQLARALAESQATAGDDLARRREEAERLEAEAASRFREAEEVAEAERAALEEESRRRTEENRQRAEAELQHRQQEELEAQQQRDAAAAAAAAAQAEAERQAADVAAAAAAREAQLEGMLDAESLAYLRQLHETGAQPAAQGASMAADLSKAEKYYDKADKLAEGATTVDSLGQAYLNYMRYTSMVTGMYVQTTHCTLVVE